MLGFFRVAPVVRIEVSGDFIRDFTDFILKERLFSLPGVTRGPGSYNGYHSEPDSIRLKQWLLDHGVEEAE